MLNIENMIKRDLGKTFTVETKLGPVEVRHYIDGTIQEELTNVIAKGVINKEGYFPMRRDLYVLFAFMLAFVVDGEEMMVSDGENFDLCENYRIFEQELGIMSRAREISASVDYILTRIEQAVDLLVFREHERQNALLSSGLHQEGRTNL